MKFTEEHEWLRDEDDVIVVGITEHASEQLGDIVFVELPEVGTQVTKDDEVVVIESVKARQRYSGPARWRDRRSERRADRRTRHGERGCDGRWLVLQDESHRIASQMDDYMDEAAYQKFIG